MTLRRLAFFFVVGGIVGTLLDRIHTWSGVLRCVHPFAWGEAWWVPLIMGTASVALVVVHGYYRRAFGEPADGTPREIGIASLWFVAVYAASGIAKDNPIALIILFVSLFFARALRTPDSRAMWAHAITAAVVGSIAEIGLTHTGEFAHLHPNVLGLPYWIPALYLHAALLGRSVERFVGRA